ncbi:MAG TPA: hypothetical protein VFJ28_13905 [Marmoricola sp.]|nr:hypothetical protein [Marmoricola sp.]
MTAVEWPGTPLTLPWGTTPDGKFTPAGAVVTAVAAIVAVVSWFPVAVLGIALIRMGLDRIPTDVVAARRYVLASWVLFAVCPLTPALVVWTFP